MATINLKLHRLPKVIVTDQSDSSQTEAESSFFLAREPDKKLPGMMVTLGIVFILGISLIVGVGVYLQRGPDIDSQNLALSSPVTSEPVSLTLDLGSPDNNQLVFDSDLLIQGTTLPHTIVIVSTNKNDAVLQSDDHGNFSTDLTLLPGVNQFSVTAFDNSGDTKVEKRTVYYSTEQL